MRIKLPIPLKIKEILSTLGINEYKSAEESIKFISTDSRVCESGDLFIALRGERYNGCDFCDEAIKRGAYAISDSVGKKIFTVGDTRLTLLKLASIYKQKLSNLKYTVGVTGSVGKTTTKEFLREIISVKYKVHATEGNYNNHIGVPLTVLTAPEDTEVLILEMGMNSKGEIRELSSFTKPDIGIITNVGTAHIGKLGSRENIANAKLEILNGMSDTAGLIIPYGEPFLSVSGAITAAIYDTSADVCISIIKEDGDGTLAHLKAKETEFDFSVKLCGEHLIKNLSLAIAAALKLQLNKNELADGISKITIDNTRQKMIKCGIFSILDDSYNSSTEAVIASLEAFCKDKSKIHTSLFSDMLELGKYSPILHFEIGKCAALCGIKRMYVFGEYSEYIKKGAMAFGIAENDIVIKGEDESLSDFVDRVYEKTENGEIILAKASHATQMKTVIKMLMERYKKNNA